MSQFTDLVHHRRSVRCFDAQKEIDPKQIQACLALSQLAPSSSNLQLYEFYHVVDQGILCLLAEACLGQQAAKTAQQMVVFVTRQDLYAQRAKDVLTFECQNIRHYSPIDRQESRIKTVERYYRFLIPMIYHQGFALGTARKFTFTALQQLRPMYTQVSEADVRVMVHKSCALAAQTFMLAMADYGYDTCPMEGFDGERVKKLLKLPESAEINMIIACGIRTEEGVWGDRFRVPFEQVYHQV